MDSKRTQIRRIEKLADLYGVKVKFYTGKKNEPAGYVNARTYDINIDKTYDDLYSTFFHELGHVYCRIHNLWPLYHNRNEVKIFEKKKLRGILTSALRAERWIDAWAKKEMSQYFPEFEYEPGYDNYLSVRWFNHNVLSHYSDMYYA